MDETFELIKTFPYSSEAFIYKGKLESEGIPAYLKDHNLIDTDPLYSQAVGGVKLYVAKTDAGKAREILSAVPEFSIDDDGKALVCPNCGAEKVEMVTSATDAKSIFGFIFTFLFLVFPFIKYRYRCRECGHEFKTR